MHRLVAWNTVAVLAKKEANGWICIARLLIAPLNLNAKRNERETKRMDLNKLVLAVGLTRGMLDYLSFTVSCRLSGLCLLRLGASLRRCWFAYHARRTMAVDLLCNHISWIWYPGLQFVTNNETFQVNNDRTVTPKSGYNWIPGCGVWYILQSKIASNAY
jgi:hypothetical protein